MSRLIYILILSNYGNFKRMIFSNIKIQGVQYDQEQILTSQDYQVWFYVKSECHKVKIWEFLNTSPKINKIQNLPND